MYQARFYRHLTDRYPFKIEVVYKNADVLILTDRRIKQHMAHQILVKYYSQIEAYSKECPQFRSSLTPIKIKIDVPTFPIIRDMLRSSYISGVGPFASVAGAVAFYVGRELLNYCEEIIVENGGDVFLKTNREKLIGIYLGKDFSPEFVTIKVMNPGYPYFGVCSSSAKIGHSLNFGLADVLTVIGKDVIVCDALATAYSNKIHQEKDIHKVINEAKKNAYVDGIVVAFNGKIYFWGEIIALYEQNLKNS